MSEGLLHPVPSPFAPSLANGRTTRRVGRTVHPAGRTTSRRSVGLDALEMIAVGLAETTPRFGHAWTDKGDRRYTCLLDTSLYDAWLIEWSPSSTLDLHDHGGSSGVVVVTAGALVEIYTDLAAPGPLRSQTIRRNDVLLVAPSRVHTVLNPGPTHACSVHVYSPPLSTMNFFDPGAALDLPKAH